MSDVQDAVATATAAGREAGNRRFNAGSPRLLLHERLGCSRTPTTGWGNNAARGLRTLPKAAADLLLQGCEYVLEKMTSTVI
jgi:hypothetical protein